MPETGRLSLEQWQHAHYKALSFRDRLVKQATNKATGNVAFYPELFRIAAELIEKDADEFCDRAEDIFDEIDAYGQEPLLDDDWLAEVTGEKDSFYFSTDSLVTHLPPLPGQKRGRTSGELDEAEVIKAVEDAIVSMEEAISVAHQEDPSSWIKRIHSVLKEERGSATFGQIRQATDLTPGALFLGLLLGQDNWHLRQKEFYGEIFVCLKNPDELNKAPK